MISSVKELENTHQGGRLFIVANGPSLTEEPLHLLENEVVCVVNKGYLTVDKGMLKKFDYFAIADHNVYANLPLEFVSKTEKAKRIYVDFVTKQKYYKQEDCYVYKKPHLSKPFCKSTFPKSIDSTFGTLYTVALETAVVASFMGFKEIYLLGVDLGFKDSNKTHFYGTGERESRISQVWNTYKNQWKVLIPQLNMFLKEKDIVFKNLSRGLVEGMPFETDRLENIIGQN